MNKCFTLGVIINPYAGIGGSVALKGSDGQGIRQQAMSLGGEKLANQKMQRALSKLNNTKPLSILTASGEMGADCCRALGLPHRIVYSSDHVETQASDTENAVSELVRHNVDLIVFAGGDGTARNVFNVVADTVPVLGVPAGCKIHSGVYAVTPSAAGNVIANMLAGELVSVRTAEVRDIDEEAFRQGKVQAQPYGEMQIPNELSYIQSVKMGGREDEHMVLNDIADYLCEIIEDEPEYLYIMGSGSTIAQVMEKMHLPNTLLGVDVIKNGQIVASDVTARELLEVISGHQSRLFITAIGGQGHVFGRGNQQLSPAVLRSIGRDNIFIAATKQKLQQLAGRPLHCDTGDEQLDQQLAGIIAVITGYQDRVFYPIQ